MPPQDLGTTSVPPRRVIPHYHGDEVKVLFLVSAVIIVFAQSTGADLPLSTTGAVFVAAMLVIIAGITNPAQVWIHWVNAIAAFFGTVVFGRDAIQHYRDGFSIIEPSFIYIEALALISLIALYFTTRTIRGLLLRTR